MAVELLVVISIVVVALIIILLSKTAILMIDYKQGSAELITLQEKLNKLENHNDHLI